MKIIPISRLTARFKNGLSPSSATQTTKLVYPPSLNRIKHWPVSQLPRFVQHSAIAMKYLTLLSVLDWEHLPWRVHTRPHPGPQPRSPIPFIAAFLVKIDQKQQHMGQLHQYLVEHPALTWVLGFPLHVDVDAPHGFDIVQSLPSVSRFSYVLRSLKRAPLDYLLQDSIQRIRLALPPDIPFGQAISLDTKHIIAWTKENNPKAYIKNGRFHKTQQPAGDRDCKLGCKRRRNVPPDKTPTQEGSPAPKLGVGLGEFYWGYASGIVVTKVPHWGEVVLAEMTQTFDHGDTSYFSPLMSQVETVLGFAPPFGTMDAAFDSFSIYEYFHQAGGFAAIPYVDRTKGKIYRFNEQGLPLCEADLPMPVKSSFFRHSARVPHQRARHVCPLLFPDKVADDCPVGHKKWAKGGCISTLPTSVGARIRYQLDRESHEYKHLYLQRTAVERIFSQAVALGIERPKLRTYQAIANHNTLIYLLINLKTQQRIHKLREQAA